MAAAFRPVNPSSLAAEPIHEDAMTPPRPNTAPQGRPHGAAVGPQQQQQQHASSPVAGAGQKPLPSSPFPQAVQVPEAADRQRRDNSQPSAKSSRRASMDVDMDDSDGDGAASDDDSVNADGSKSSKKKSQRFYCTDYPPCNLSFTRSEHLARHIRKHTGERPFQCHCSRRFSRLDNLRQHAQTVHVNEDIPIDSLAATGSRFQRQMRTDRVRQAGNRARASTGGSAGGPARGHSKSLSTSSIASMGSVVAGAPYAAQPGARRRAPALVMAADPRSRLSVISYRSAADSTYSYRPPSPGDFSTPTSATFSTAQSSPRWPSAVASPLSHLRSQSLYAPGSRIPVRRLSVPSGANPFQPAHHHGPALINSSHPAAFPPSHGPGPGPGPGTLASAAARRDSASTAADEAWRRRTWHPDSRGYGSQPGGQHQLSAVGSQSVRPNPAPPIANPASAHLSFRLPGIESFDPIPRRNPSPMAVDADPGHRPVYQPAEPVQPDEHRNLNMYDAGLQRGLTRLDIGLKTPPRDSAGAWASEVNRAVQAQAERVRQTAPTVRFENQLLPSRHSTSAGRSLHQHNMSAPSMPSRDTKRHGRYHGPPAPLGAGAPQQAQEPRVAHVERMVHPNLTGFGGFPAHEAPPPPKQQQQQDRPPNADPLRRLEALVAVVTSEGSTATAY